MAATTQPKSTRRERWSWYMYDFGNSAYAAVVLLAVYSAYFQGEVVGGPEGTRLWGIAVFIAMLVVAVSSPFLGAIADYSGAKKRFLFFFTSLAVVFTSLLFFATPGAVFIGMLFFILAEIGYRAAQVFYNGLLPEIADQDEMGHISGNGWAIGTAGGVICLLLILPLVVVIGGTLIVRFSLVITAVFFAVSAIPIFLWLPERAKPKPIPAGDNSWTIAIKQLKHTIRTAGGFKEFLKFMLAFIIYNDGVIMALDFAAIIGAVLFGMEQEQLIIFVIVVQITNVIGAYGFGRAVDRFRGKPTLILSLLLMIVVIIAMYFTQTMAGFFVVGAIAGIAMAGIQSVSRTMVAFFAPPGKSAEFYGLFAFAGRTSSLIGPTVYGFIAAEVALYLIRQGEGDLLAEQIGQRYAILSIAVFLIIGLIVLLWVDEDKARVAALVDEAGEV
ncbi:MAG: MFS transporter [Anaerolineae bacterium]|nr:MFS transporter [Anaerolineae bacterium]MCO5191641.1 MFS transporter [Anaerolineae bacterium]MCO5195941.1 MFS transporter [Anaerolineae bacterium]